MTVHEKMQTVFTAANVSGYLNYWRPTASETKPPQTLAVYTVTRERALVCADDVPIVMQHEVQIDLYSVNDPSDAVDDLESVLRGLRFSIPAHEEVNDMLQGEYRYHIRLSVYYID